MDDWSKALEQAQTGRGLTNLNTDQVERFASHVRAKGYYIQSMEGFEILPDGSEQLNLDISILGLEGEFEDRNSIDRQAKLVETKLANSRALNNPSKFIVWVDKIG